MFAVGEGEGGVSNFLKAGLRRGALSCIHLAFALARGLSAHKLRACNEEFLSYVLRQAG